VELVTAGRWGVASGWVVSNGNGKRPRAGAQLIGRADRTEPILQRKRNTTCRHQTSRTIIWASFSKKALPDAKMDQMSWAKPASSCPVFLRKTMAPQMGRNEKTTYVNQGPRLGFADFGFRKKWVRLPVSGAGGCQSPRVAGRTDPRGRNYQGDCISKKKFRKHGVFLQHMNIVLAVF